MNLLIDGRNTEIGKWIPFINTKFSAIAFVKQYVLGQSSKILKITYIS